MIRTREVAMFAFLFSTLAACSAPMDSNGSSASQERSTSALGEPDGGPQHPGEEVLPSSDPLANEVPQEVARPAGKFAPRAE